LAIQIVEGGVYLQIKLDEHVDKCPCCGNKKQTLFWCMGMTMQGVDNQMKVEYVLCSKCQLVYLLNRMSANNTYDFYKNDYRDVIEQTKGYNQGREVKRQIKRCEVLLKMLREVAPDFTPAIHLDVGCDVGYMLGAVKATYKDCLTFGVEWNKDHAKRAEEKGYIVYPDLEYIHAKGEIDLVTLSHVLEHMNEPVKELKQIHKVMRSNGYLVIEVPNREVTAVAYRPVHSLAFNTWSLQKTIEKAGFTFVVAFVHQGTMPYPIGYYLGMIVQKKEA
jgi:SAM-dependent methyltransferase